MMVRKNRFKFVWPLEKMTHGTLEVGVRDPNGYILAFAEQNA